MNKVLVFTTWDKFVNFDRRLRARVPQWNENYPDNNRPLVWCDTSNSPTCIQAVSDLSKEGVYLIFQSIDPEVFNTLLQPYANDQFYVLIHHNGMGFGGFSRWPNCFVLRGQHTNNPCDLYRPLFEILINDISDKLEHIIKEVFLPGMKEEFVVNFVKGCDSPQNTDPKLEKAYEFLCSIDEYKEHVVKFYEKYKKSQTKEDYASEFITICELLNE